jgi:hypothetical protein
MERQGLEPGSTNRVWAVYLTLGAGAIVAGVVLLATGHRPTGGGVVSFGVWNLLMARGQWLLRRPEELPDIPCIAWIDRRLAGKAPPIVGALSFLMGVAAAGLMVGCLVAVILLDPVDGGLADHVLVVVALCSLLATLPGLAVGIVALRKYRQRRRVFAAWGTALSGLALLLWVFAGVAAVWG